MSQESNNKKIRTWVLYTFIYVFYYYILILPKYSLQQITSFKNNSNKLVFHYRVEKHYSRGKDSI